MSLDQVKKDFRNWLVTVTGLADGNVFWSQQNAPKTALDFLTLNITTDISTQKTAGDQMQINSDGTQTMYRSREACLSINGYGLTSDTFTKSIQDSIDLPKSMQLFQSKGFVVVSKDGKARKNLTFIESGQWLQRWMMELYIGYTDVFTTDLTDVGYFTEIDMTGNFYGIGKSIPGDDTKPVITLDTEI